MISKKIVEWSLSAVKLIPLIVGAVHAVEKVAGARKGKEKQDAAVEAITAMIVSTEVALDTELINEKTFNDLLRRMIDDYVAIQNYIAEHRKSSPGVAKP